MLLSILLTILTIPINSFAEENNTLDFNNGENQKQLTDTKTIHVNNGTNSTISILEDGQEVFKEEFTLIKVASIEKVSLNGQQFAIVNYRYNGTSNALFFEVLKLNSEGVKKIFESNVFERATFELLEDEIKVTYPIYGEGDVMTNPSKLATKLFHIENDKVSAGEETVEKLNNSLLAPRSLKGFTTNTNDYAKINKILTEEALKADVSPEIVKAIAYQERDRKSVV